MIRVRSWPSRFCSTTNTWSWVAMKSNTSSAKGKPRSRIAMRLRGFPFADEVFDFIATHDQVFVVEQNRDGQLRTLIMNEGGVDPAKLVAVNHYDGTPI